MVPAGTKGVLVPARLPPLVRNGLWYQMGCRRWYEMGFGTSLFDAAGTKWDLVPAGLTPLVRNRFWYQLEAITASSNSSFALAPALPPSSNFCFALAAAQYLATKKVYPIYEVDLLAIQIFPLNLLESKFLFRH